MNEKLTYSDSGVDIHEGYRAVELMKEHVKGTFNKNVLTGLGGFGGLFGLDLEGIKEPVLVSGTDGVGTKLKIAFMMDKHDTVGQDLVAMCVNDILCQGAKPLFFLDYIATGKLKAEKAADLVKGVADGCKLSGSALIGGETAEMPGFYNEGEYDLAGFSVGIVDKSKIITGAEIEESDIIIGLQSSGVHSNGFSLVRKLFFDKLGYGVDTKIDELDKTLGEILIEPTKIYVDPVLNVLKKINVKGMSHITGGGFIENIPRVLPKGLDALIHLGTWDMLPIFKYLHEKSGLSNEEIYNTFNMGIGFIMVVSKEDVDKTLELLKNNGEKPFVIGEIAKGNKGVKLCQV